MRNTPQHIKFPRSDRNIKLTAYDYATYACMRRFMDKNTGETFISANRISDDYKVTRKVVSASILKLKELEYISNTGKKHNRATIWKFNESVAKQFEMFSFDFLDHPKISFKNKGVYIALQFHLFKPEGMDYFSTQYTNAVLSKKTGIPENDIQRAFKAFKDEGLLYTVTTKVKDPETGLRRQSKIIDAAQMCQAILYVNEKVDKLDERTLSHDKMIQMLQREIEELKKAQQSQVPKTFVMNN